MSAGTSPLHRPLAGSGSAHPARLDRLVGAAALVFSALYVVADVIETVQGGFSTFRLALTLIAEVSIPLFVLGLYAVQRPRISRLGLYGAIAFAYTYTFFTATVAYALVEGTPNWSALRSVFGIWLTVHGIVMVAGGLAFGWATVQAAVLPRWTGICLMVGVILVAAVSAMSDLPRTLAEAVTATAFMGMGVSLLAKGGAASDSPSP